MRKRFVIVIVFDNVDILNWSSDSCWNHITTFFNAPANRCGQSWSKPSIIGCKFQMISWRSSARWWRCCTMPAWCKLSAVFVSCWHYPFLILASMIFKTMLRCVGAYRWLTTFSVWPHRSTRPTMSTFWASKSCCNRFQPMWCQRLCRYLPSNCSSYIVAKAWTSIGAIRLYVPPRWNTSTWSNARLVVFSVLACDWCNCSARINENLAIWLNCWEVTSKFVMITPISSRPRWALGWFTESKLICLFPSFVNLVRREQELLRRSNRRKVFVSDHSRHTQESGRQNIAK